MLTACWSVKGGSGTTVVTVSLALLWARTLGDDVVVADLAGDVPAVLGLPDRAGPGLLDWVAAGPEVAPGALRKLCLPAAATVAMIPKGTGTARDQAAGERLAAALTDVATACVVDCGSDGDDLGMAIASSAALSLLVLRPCYLALRRAIASPIRPSGVVLVGEPGRALGRADVEDVLGVPVRAEVPWDPAVARAVDAGVLPSRFPRGLERALRSAA